MFNNQNAPMGVSGVPMQSDNMDLGSMRTPLPGMPNSSEMSPASSAMAGGATGMPSNMPAGMPAQATPQAPMSPSAPPAQPNLFKMWKKDPNEGYVDLTAGDVDVLLKQVQSNPQLGAKLWAAAQQQNKTGASLGDFRKDALAGGAHLMNLLGGKNGSF